MNADVAFRYTYMFGLSTRFRRPAYVLLCINHKLFGFAQECAKHFIFEAAVGKGFQLLNPRGYAVLHNVTTTACLAHKKMFASWLP